MARLIVSIWPLLIAVALLIGGNGMQGTALSVRGTIEGFTPQALGLIFSTYSFGFIVGCRYAPRFVAAVGHIRAFTAFASLASASALAHPLLVNEGAWFVLRIITGFSFAAMQMVLESWLNESATNQTRGQVLSIYRITDFTAVTAAQLMLIAFDPQSFVIFALISIAFSIALVPVALTRVKAPGLPATARLDIGRLWRLSPAAVAGVIAVGLSGAAYWSMMPLFISEAGFSTTLVGVMVATIIFGGALSQFPIGRLSDRTDRRFVLVACSFGAAVSAFALPFSASMGLGPMLANGMVFGALYLPNYGIAVAHANDHAAPGTALSVNSGLLMLHGVSAVVGPMVVSTLIPYFSADILFYWIGGVFVLAGVFGVYRITRRARPAETSTYVAVSRTASTGAVEMDPRVDTSEPPDARADS